jgi:hypothetical protein
MSDDASAALLVARFQAIRAEIDRRSTHQQAVIALNISAIGALGAFALSHPDQVVVLLVLPILCLCLGLIYLDHAKTIEHLASYMQVHVEPAMSELGVSVAGWEDTQDRYEANYLERFFVYALPITLVFVAAPLYALLRTVSVAFNASSGQAGLGRHDALMFLWMASAVLTAAFLVPWGQFVMDVFRAGRRTAAKPGRRRSSRGIATPHQRTTTRRR